MKSINKRSKEGLLADGLPAMPGMYVYGSERNYTVRFLVQAVSRSMLYLKPIGCGDCIGESGPPHLYFSTRKGAASVYESNG